MMSFHPRYGHDQLHREPARGQAKRSQEVFPECFTWTDGRHRLTFVAFLGKSVDNWRVQSWGSVRKRWTLRQWHQRNVVVPRSHHDVISVPALHGPHLSEAGSL